ncbi:SurA N-terminal domain-containing protein [Neomegalonema sp.]|uniref:SurA N-terminal domain-containing protein n=1 Tax=Neomegalonema sp. TaxID=2039713 RepID=UPI0026050293|nr:SurA N-terminal domain-containing protein [Neomegalonema sp.]MDD2869412.1 SurA N-terminal domain-containing protein [Neomegalonema sp.]
MSSPFRLRAPRRARALSRLLGALATGSALLAASGAAPDARAQSALAPFDFPATRPVAPVAAQAVAAQPVAVQAAPAPQGAAATWAEPSPYAAQLPYAPTGATPPALRPEGWRGVVTTEAGFSGAAPAQAAQVRPAALATPVLPAAAPIYDPAPQAVMRAPVQSAPPLAGQPVRSAPPQVFPAPPPVSSARPAAAPSGSGGANIFTPVATVNDRVITRFDVEQRARILAAADEASGVSPASLLNEALQSLVDDQVKIQAAKAAGIEANPEALSRGLGEVAQQNGMALDAMLAFFQARGVARTSVEAQVTSEIVWREYLRARHGSRIEPTDLEIATAAAADPSRTRDQIRSRIVSERATLTSRSALQELRRRAVIEMKTN